MDTQLGSKIRLLRKQKKLTLKDISEKTNLSISFLSQLEHAKTSATLETFKKISEALNVSPSYFFPHPKNDEQSTIVRAQSHDSGLQESSFIYKNLANHMSDSLFLPLLIILHPGDNRGNIFSHKGQEFLFVLEGMLTVLIQDKEYTLYPQDSIFIDSSTPHYWKNNTNEMIKFLCVSAEDS